MTLLRTFCCCGSLRTGTIFTAIAGALLAAIGIILMYTLNIDLRTILLDNLLPKWAVKLILVINFCMTIFISLLLLYGAIKRHMYFMLPWVILGLLLALGLLISVIYTAIIEFNQDRNIEGTIWLVGGFIAVGRLHQQVDFIYICSITLLQISGLYVYKYHHLRQYRYRYVKLHKFLSFYWM